MIQITVKQRKLGATKSKGKSHTTFTMYCPNVKIEYSGRDTAQCNIRAQYTM